MTTWMVVLLMAAHGSLHFLGVAKAFGWAELATLSQPISRAQGVLWLAAGVTTLLAAVGIVWAPRLWWILGLSAVLLSQAAIASAWKDAAFGTIANALVLALVVHGFASQGPLGLRAAFSRGVEARLAASATPEPLTEADLAHLPEPVREYLRVTGSVGKPKILNFQATWVGRIRADADSPWMSFSARQFNTVEDPSRLFLMDARRAGIPVDVLHVFADGGATMRVRVLSMVQVQNASGPDLTRAETVTLLNDLCVLAPASLIDRRVQWEAIDDHSARARFTLGSNTVSAVLIFNAAGELVDFVSEDRLASSPDGSTFVPRRWSTPIRDYRSFGDRRLMGFGQGVWHPPEGAFAYIELELVDVGFNVTSEEP